ncbi:hypothetical protein BLOT_009133 [Blomia tropicalis]|nr:hypothetical protein BLOT_009133 [Blomia tropicalis]
MSISTISPIRTGPTNGNDVDDLIKLLPSFACRFTIQGECHGKVKYALKVTCNTTSWEQFSE